MPTPSLSIDIERDSAEPIYQQVIRNIRTQIESGDLPAGTKLPASRALAKQLAISRISVVNAYADLRAAGFLSATRGRGTFVAKRAQHHPGTALAPTAPPAPAPDEALPAIPNHHSLRDMMRMAGRAGMINFSHGSPPQDFYPVARLREALNDIIERDGTQALAYETPEGYLPLRATVRDFVAPMGIQCHTDDVLITGGAQQGIDLVVQALLREGETLVTSNPTYVGILDIARTRRVTIKGIPMDADGIRLDLLERYFIDHAPRLLYVMPTFHNPTGQVMPLHRRRQLLRLAAAYDVTVLEDAVYQEFHFDSAPPPPLMALDEAGSVIHVSAFTKMLLPGMRIGYLIANRAQYERLVRVKLAADISTSGLNQRAIHLLVQRGVLASQLERNNQILRQRCEVALRAAARYFPQGSQWAVPQGGLYLWVTLPENGPTAAELFVAAVQKQVAFAIGDIFHITQASGYQMRLNFGLQPPALIEEGFRRIGEAWASLAQPCGDLESAPVL